MKTTRKRLRLYSFKVSVKCSRWLGFIGSFFLSSPLSKVSFFHPMKLLDCCLSEIYFCVSLWSIYLFCLIMFLRDLVRVCFLDFRACVGDLVFLILRLSRVWNISCFWGIYNWRLFFFLIQIVTVWFTFSYLTWSSYSLQTSSYCTLEAEPI